MAGPAPSSTLTSRSTMYEGPTSTASGGPTSSASSTSHIGLAAVVTGEEPLLKVWHLVSVAGHNSGLVAPGGMVLSAVVPSTNRPDILAVVLHSSAVVLSTVSFPSRKS